MNTHLKVSIVIPVYNGANYLASAIDSALAQTYPNIEVVVVNDGSRDDGQTEAVAQRYAGRIKYIAQPNMGVAGALNTGLAHMTGDIFAWLSHDDIHLPHKTARQVAFFERLGRSDAMLFSDYYLIDNDGKRITEVKLDHERYVRSPMLPLFNGCINGCTLFIPAHIMRQYGPFDTRLRFTQDYDLWNKMLRDLDFFHQPETLIEYRIHSEQDTQKQKSKAALECDELWKRMLDDRTEIERVHMFGSTKRFFHELSDFLERTPYQKVAAYARKRAKYATKEAKVSFILVFHNDIANVSKTIRYVLNQTHRRLELILIDNESTEAIDGLEALIAADTRVRLIRRPQTDLSQARNRWLEYASGEYIVLLNPGDIIAPDKILRQLGAMQDAGSLISYTDCLVSFPGRHGRVVRLGSGSGENFDFSRSESDIPISTIMMHRYLFDAGFQFQSLESHGVDTIDWTFVTQRFAPLRITEPYSAIVLATPQLRQSFGPATLNSKGDRGESLLLGDWYAQAGDLREAIRYFEQHLSQNPSDDSGAYKLASCLAAAGDHAEADAIFQRGLSLMCGHGKPTTSDVIRLPSPDRNIRFGGPITPPFLRVVTFNANIATHARAGVRAEAVYFVCCDSKYFNLFILPLAYSIVSNSNLKCVLHVHVVNPSDIQATVHELRALETLPVVLSSESVRLDDLDEDEKKTYFACCRFYMLPALQNTYELPVIVNDVDQMVLGDLGQFLQRAREFDVSFIRFQDQSFNFLVSLSASVCVANATEGGIRFSESVRTYLAERMNETMGWHLDQAAIAVTHLAEPHLRYNYLPPSIMISDVDEPLAQEPCNGHDHALFWTITYSQPKDVLKLKQALKGQTLLPTDAIQNEEITAEEKQEDAAMNLDAVATEVLAEELAKRIEKMDGHPVHDVFYRRNFHLLRKHFYLPIPDDTDGLDEFWERPSELPGIDMNEACALDLIDRVFPPYLGEFRERFSIKKPERNTLEFHLINGGYMAVDAHVYYCLLRHYRPSKIVEIGNGNSTLLAMAAKEYNGQSGAPCELISIDPFPWDAFRNGYSGLDELIVEKVQNVPMSLFESLKENDLLFIDSSHVLRSGNDVHFEYLEVLPRLKPGVLVHVHDISLPKPYPKVYFDNHLYWNEQYLLQAFLAFNSRFQVLWPGNYMMLKHPELMHATFPEIRIMRETYPQAEPSAFWMRVKS